MKKGIFANAWEQAMQKHEIYKKEKFEQIEVARHEFKDEISKKTTGVLIGIGLYYLQRIKNFLESFFKNRVSKK